MTLEVKMQNRAQRRAAKSKKKRQYRGLSKKQVLIPGSEF